MRVDNFYGASVQVGTEDTETAVVRVEYAGNGDTTYMHWVMAASEPLPPLSYVVGQILTNPQDNPGTCTSLLAACHDHWAEIQRQIEEEG